MTGPGRRAAILAVAGAAGAVAATALLRGANVAPNLIAIVVTLFAAVCVFALYCLRSAPRRADTPISGTDMTRIVFDGMDSAIAVTDGEGLVAVADSGFTAMLGDAGSIPERLATWFHTGDGTDAEEEFRKMGVDAAAGRAVRIEVQTPGDRQASPWFDIAASPVALPPDGRAGVIWQVRDISRLRHRTEQLGDRLALLSRALDQAPFGLAVLDDSLAVREVNATFRSLIGKDKVTGRPVVELFDAADKAALLAILDQAKDGGASADSDIGLAALSVDAHPEGLLESTVTVNVSPPTRSRGGGGGLLLHLVDATRRRQLELQFAQSQKMQALGQLAGGVAHDFNNMLTAMIGFCDLVLQRHHPGEQSFADIMQIKQNANRAAGLVRQLLAFSRQQPLAPRVLDLGEVLSELSSLLRRVLGERIELDVMHSRESVRVKVDQSQLEQVLINLAVNARDAMEGSGRLEIVTDRRRLAKKRRIGLVDVPAGDFVTVTVADSGPGIPDKIADRIFDPFFTTKEIGAGTGLGLSMVYGSLEQMGGVVTVENRRAAAGGGAAFSLFIPVAPETAVADEEETDSDGDADDVTGEDSVLLVEDEDPVRLFSARALRGKGYRVTEARTGAAALEILADMDFDLLVTDMMMPEVDGATLIRQARLKTPDLPVICISGYTRESVADEVSALPNVHFLPKPFSLKQLVGKVRAALDSAVRE